MTQTAATVDSARAWVVGAAAFLAMLVVFGIAYSYGAFLPEIAEEFSSGRAAVSGVFSLTTFALFGLGLPTGAAADRFGPRPVLLVGAVSLVGGLLLTAAASSLWVAYLGFGLGVGFAVACGYVPMVALVGGWFERLRTLAVGLAVSGIGLGTLIGAPLAAGLIDSLGWRSAYVALAVGGGGVLVLCSLVVGPAPMDLSQEGLPLREAVRNRAYQLLYLSAMLLSVALFVPFVHLPTYAQEQGIDPVLAAGLVGVIGAASIVGRLVLAGLAARLGALRTFQTTFAIMAISFAVWWLGGGYPVLAVFAALLGVGYGGFVAVSPAVLAEAFGTQRLGGLLGLMYTSAAIGSAFGPPVAGSLRDATGSYTPAIVGALVIASAAFALTLRIGGAMRTRPT